MTQTNPEPYCSTDLGELYHRDALEFIDHLVESGETVQMVFADPPYNIGKADWDRFEDDEYLDWTVDWVSAIGDLLPEDGSAFVCGFSEVLADIQYRLSREADWVESVSWLVWHYRNKPQMGNGGWTRSHESILWLRKSDEFKFEIDRVRIPYNSHTEKYPMREQGQSSLFGSEDGYQWDPNLEGAKPRDVIDVPTVNNASSERTDHPTQKPEELLRKFVWATTDKEQLVCDVFGGSGTTFAVCEQLGRRWVGSESKAEYCEMIDERLSDIGNRKDPAYWMEHDLERREHRRKVRYGRD
jgi:site-specific DNA-methyltransferase (adenine-specific)